MKFLRDAFLFLMIAASSCAFAQQAVVDQYADTLNVLARRMQRGSNDTIAAKNDSVRFAAADAFQKIIEKILSDSASFGASFEAIKIISLVSPSDNSFRLYTWNYPNYEGTVYRYYGYLQIPDSKKKSGRNKKNNPFLITLYDRSTEIEKPMSKKLKSDQWYGAVYYSLIENKKGKKKYYTLLSWHGKDRISTQKIIDVLSFDGAVPVFGLPIFKAGDIYHNRIIFEFTSQAVMSVRYVANRNLIIFDHLASTNKKNEPNLDRMIGPDGSYDAFKFKKGHWELVEDVDVNNDYVPKKPDVRVIKDAELKGK